MPRRGRGGACCGGQGADDQDGVDGAALDGERVEQCADGAAASRTSTPGSQAQVSKAQRLCVDWAMRPDSLVTVVDVAPAGRGGDVEGEVAVEPDRTQLRLPAPGKQRASRQQIRRGGALARTCRWPAQVASRLGGRGVYGVGQAREQTAASCACTCSMRNGLARTAAGPTEAAPHVR